VLSKPSSEYPKEQTVSKPSSEYPRMVYRDEPLERRTPAVFGSKHPAYYAVVKGPDELDAALKAGWRVERVAPDEGGVVVPPAVAAVVTEVNRIDVELKVPLAAPKRRGKKAE